MAYNRYDQRRGWREGEARGRQGSDRWRGGSSENEDRDRGFFERAGDEIASWFGDEEADRRRQRDNMDRYREDEPGDYRGRSSWGRQEDDHGRFGGGQSYGRGRDAERDYGRGYRRGGGESGGFSSGPRYAEGREGGWAGGAGSSQFDQRREQFGRRDYSSTGGGDYRPFSGDVGRSDSWQDRYYGGTSPGYRSSAEEYEAERGAGRFTSGRHDPHYHEWRQRQIESLDQDYDDYRRENQSRFEDEFSTWRGNRQTKRQMLSQVRDHMEVVGNDDEHVGKVDRVSGDRIILTKGDDPSGRHHSLMCTLVERVEGDRVILNTTAEKARQQWRDDDRERALFEREDQGSAGPGILNRSFSGTYR